MGFLVSSYLVLSFHFPVLHSIRTKMLDIPPQLIIIYKKLIFFILMEKLESFLLCFPDVNSQIFGRITAISCDFKENYYYYFDT